MFYKIWRFLSGLIFIISLLLKGVFIGNYYGSDLERES